MNDAALTKPGAYAQVRVREPAGERTLGAEPTIGGPGADIVVPGAPDGPAARIERRGGDWLLMAETGAPVRFDGRPLASPRELRRNDVLTIGDAQLVVLELSRTRLRIDVVHLIGNDTIAPVAMVVAEDLGGGDEELEIRAGSGVAATLAGAATARGTAAAGAESARLSRKVLIAAIVGIACLLAAVVLVTLLESVSLDVQPAKARISAPGTFLALKLSNRLYVLPGRHVVRGELEGYLPSQTEISVSGDTPAAARLRLVKLPGRLAIDTSGIAATVSVDGAERGRAPGELDVPPGAHTITLRAPRYLDHVVNLDIQGAGVRQELKVVLQSSWGALKVSAIPGAAKVSVDGRDSGVAPATAEVPSGVHRVRIESQGLKTWESSVVVRAGQTLSIGPITLGQPDAHLTIRSQPAGAEVSIGGTYRGHTPFTAELPAGIAHEVIVSLPGYTTWTRSVFAEPDRKIQLDAQLQAVLAKVTVSGNPDEADLFIDRMARGRTPQTLSLTTVEHSIEVRKEGFVPFTVSVTPETALERTVSYKLTSADPAIALQESAPTIATKSGYMLRLVPTGTFRMGSERREQGRRPNEGLREVTFKRPFYIGVTEVTNAQFRKFRASHVTGYISKYTLDLDNQPVASVSWDDAAAYCNWLSELEGFPPAYEAKDGKLSLKRPVTTGYRLPTEAEWEYAARYAGPGKTWRFAWGDNLPVVANSGNLAGSEAKGLLELLLDDYRDDYAAVAPVGKFAPSALGLHDMAGNVSEWVNDTYASFVDSSPATDPLGPEAAGHHVVRGANWKSAAVAELRLAWRDWGDDASQDIGFRVARYAE